MLTVIFVIFVVVSIVCGICATKHRSSCYNDNGKLALIIVAGMCAGIAVIVGIFEIVMWSNVATEYAIDQKIEMYQAENDEIEDGINTIVKEYMTHEKETFESVSPDSDAMTRVSLFPELKSDELVKQQINLHAKNAAEIKRLKEQKIDLAVEKWLLYFGR